MAAEIVEAAKLNGAGKVVEENWEAGGRGGSSEADDALAWASRVRRSEVLSKPSETSAVCSHIHLVS